jgi:hypothetical protein
VIVAAGHAAAPGESVCPQVYATRHIVRVPSTWLGILFTLRCAALYGRFAASMSRKPYSAHSATVTANGFASRTTRSKTITYT